ncbi:Fic family protein, partial [archaeon]|nr:Fic family protein [archaeon]
KKINNWIENYNSKKEEINYEKIKRLHIDFEHIHPFRDGNGRTGRILMNIQLINSNLPLKIIHQGEEQQKYYGWFKLK